jgi:hypothetical protein
MTLVVAIGVGVTVALPLWNAWQVWRLDEPSRTGRFAAVAESAAVVALVLGREDVAGLYTRWLLLAVSFSALLWSVSRLVGSDRSWAGARGRSGSFLLCCWWQHSVTSCIARWSSRCARPRPS